MKMNHESFLNALLNNKVVTRREDGTLVDPNASFQKMVAFDSIEDVLRYMYSLRHTPNIYKPEFSVYNPNPSRPTGDFILPHDLFLKEEAKKILDLPQLEFISYCRKLVEKKNIPVISLIFGADEKDTIRVTFQGLFRKNIRAICDGDIPCIISVTGGTKQENRDIWMSIALNASADVGIDCFI